MQQRLVDAVILIEKNSSEIKYAEKTISREGYDIDVSKFDYFYGNVGAPNLSLKLSGPKIYKQLEHNYQRSQQICSILESQGFWNTVSGKEKLLNFFDIASKAPTLSTHSSEFGTTVAKVVETANVKYEVKFFHSIGDVSSVPKITTLIPKVKK
jgi:hypothetical protein